MRDIAAAQRQVALTSFVRAVRHRRTRPVRVAALLRLHGDGVRMVPDAGHLGQRAEQAGGRAGVRVPGRLDRRSVRPAPVDDGGNSDGRWRPRRAGAHDVALDVLPVLPVQRRGLCLRWTAAESSAPVTLVRPHAWQGDGLRVSGHRRRRHARAAPVGAAGGDAGLAWRAADARHSDHRAGAPIRVFRTGRILRIPASAAPAAARPDAKSHRRRSGRSFEHLRSTCSRSAACARSRRSAERTSI